MNLSKSRYCNAYQCKKMLWLNDYKNEVKEDILPTSVLDNGTEVGEVAKNLLGDHIDIEFNTDLNKMIKDTKEALKKDNVVITEASFNYENNFCSVDLLKKANDNYEIYEVKSSTEVSPIYIEDISYQVYVLKGLNMNVTKSYIVHLNSNYVRKGLLELDKLFIKEDVTELALSKQDEIKQNIIDINKYMKQKEEPKESLSINCMSPYKCPFFNYCSRNLVKPNIFDIKGMQKKSMFKLYNEGIISYEDIYNSDINDKYKEVVDFIIHDKKDKINVNNIKDFLNTLTHPLYFLDFETYQQSIPEFDGVSPYMQIPFQYSLHYIIDDKLYHKEFLAESNIDPRRSLALSLVNDIPKNTCVLAYNMSFEKNVIKNLAKLYPDLSDHLMNIHSNIKDLMIPFYKRDYYTKDMLGSYSIKYVLPALFPNDESLNYHNLDLIHNGSEAMNSYKMLEKMDEETRLKVRNSLLKYCELDTYAMVKIYEKLKDIAS